MKRVLLPVLLMSSAMVMAQQSFSGLKNGYRSGVHRVLSNPANIAGSSYKWHANVLSIGLSSGTDAFSIGMDNMGEDLDRIILSSSKGLSTEQFSAGASGEVLWPSFMFRINKKQSLAVTARSRILMNIENMNTNFFRTLFGEINDYGWDKSVAISLKKQSLRMNSFTDIGLTWAGTVLETPKHTLRVGATAKYVFGSFNAYFSTDDLTGTLTKTEDGVTLDASGKITIVGAGINYRRWDNKVFEGTEANTVGFDLGVTYEYRAGNKPNADYTLKAGLSVTDIGSLKYTADIGSYAYQLKNTSITYYQADFEGELKEVAAKTAVGDYNVSLPTALQTYVDYNAGGGLGVELSGQFGLTKGTQQNPYYGTDISLTPRFEKKYFGFFLPISYSNITKVNMGTVLKLGPVFVGSGTILSNVMGNSKGVDVFAGISFGM